MNDDEVLLAWLRSRGYTVVMDTFKAQRLTRQTYAMGDRCDVTAEHLNMWTDPTNQWSSMWNIRLYAEQRGKRRPLRGLIRELVIGL